MTPTEVGTLIYQTVSAIPEELLSPTTPVERPALFRRFMCRRECDADGRAKLEAEFLPQAADAQDGYKGTRGAADARGAHPPAR